LKGFDITEKEAEAYKLPELSYYGLRFFISQRDNFRHVRLNGRLGVEQTDDAVVWGEEWIALPCFSACDRRESRIFECIVEYSGVKVSRTNLFYAIVL
jgi:hypothetical protein